jgi:hypothetical protein
VLNRNNHHTLDAKDHDGSMSHLGHSRRFDHAPIISGLPRKADIFRVGRHFGFVPLPDSCIAANRVLFNHLVGDLL